jgi:hypothetical protein
VRGRLALVAQTLVMAAIVTSALYVPAGVLIALAFVAAGVPLESVLRFGGLLPLLGGLAAWWGILFVPALVYSAFVMPWHGVEPSG